jgi:hypothetical protein
MMLFRFTFLLKRSERINLRVADMSNTRVTMISIMVDVSIGLI